MQQSNKICNIASECVQGELRKYNHDKEKDDGGGRGGEREREK